jgi:DNA primase
MPKISPSTVEEIKRTADILDVVSEYVSLQPAGKNYKGLCPFHNEKTPSFFVSKERNLFQCFGCGEKGDSVIFVQKFKNISYGESLRLLADKYHIAIDTTDDARANDSRERYYEINEAAMTYYTLNLTNLEKGQKALQYMQNRGLDIHTIQYFDIGYAPSGGSDLYQHLQQKYTEIDLLSIGLIGKNEAGHYYDMFRDRIMFPIKNERGRVVGFSGRIYLENAHESKYVNSPYNEIFIKGEILYNLDRAQPFIRQSKRVVLYEGFMDVIASIKAGVKEAVCSMGTALTSQHARLLKQYTPKVIMCYDGDSAGFEAAYRAIPILQKAELEVAIVVLPEGLDPDDYQKKYSAKAFQDYLNTHEIDTYEFFYLHMKSGYDLSKPAQIEALKNRVFNFLRETNSQTIAEIYLQHLVSDLHISFKAIQSDFDDFLLAQAITISIKEKKSTPKYTGVINRFQIAEEGLVNYFCHTEDFRQKILDELTMPFTLDDMNYELIVNIQDILEQDPTLLTKERILNKTTSQARRALLEKRFYADDYVYTMHELDDLIHTIKLRNIEHTIKRLESERDMLDSEKDRQLFLELSNQIKQLRLKILHLKERKENNGKKGNHRSAY